VKRELLKILVCPNCKGTLRAPGDGREDIDEGTLSCENCSEEYLVTNGIPRFVALENYGSSFGYQWNLFRKDQIDSFNGTKISSDRFWSETNWTQDELAGKWVLDVGCGAGRFLDVASLSDGQIVGMDISSAIDAAKANLVGRENVHFIQASIYDPPFREGTFDLCYCIGVIQHTPDPERSLRSVGSVVKREGKLAVTIYPRKFYTKLYSKYWLRQITRRMSKHRLLEIIRKVMPVLFPVTSFLFQLPVLGRVFMFVIPVANYVNEPQLNKDQRYAWAILDTFDMLSPYFDQPMTEEEARRALSSEGIEAVRLTNAGLNLTGKKA
jgi:ubiquinone/menaquinone biosynthesis C-methylase UbiE/uncharacterized protein YbaR (Trm112 family)